MILQREFNEKGELRIKSFCDSCKRVYWSNIEKAVRDIEIRPGNYEYIVSVCPDCINKYDLDIRFAILNDTLDDLIEKRKRRILRSEIIKEKY